MTYLCGDNCVEMNKRMFVPKKPALSALIYLATETTTAAEEEEEERYVQWWVFNNIAQHSFAHSIHSLC